MAPQVISPMQRELKNLTSMSDPVPIDVLQKWVDRCTLEEFKAAVTVPFLFEIILTKNQTVPTKRRRENVNDLRDAPPSSVGMRTPLVYPLPSLDLTARKTRKVVCIGGAVGNDIVIPDPSISPKHAIITMAEDGLYLSDLGSRNGVFLNGIELQFREVVSLTDGDEICLGMTKFVFVFPRSVYEKLKFKKNIHSVDDVITASGRVNYSYLKGLARDNEKSAFIDLIAHPVLMGAALFRGQLRRPAQAQSANENETFRFADLNINPHAHASHTITMAVLEKSIFILFDRKQNCIGGVQSQITIGRDPENDLVMQDPSISRVHARLRIAINGYFLQDNGSTNGSSINNIVCGREETSIKANDMIQFGRYQFRFLSPADLYEKLILEVQVL
ncbi:MAG: FHA domain-containing protein [Magnetococcus sp. YQC-5]